MELGTAMLLRLVGRGALSVAQGNFTSRSSLSSISSLLTLSGRWSAKFSVQTPETSFKVVIESCYCGGMEYRKRMSRLVFPGTWAAIWIPQRDGQGRNDFA
ncbi:hypothetical protein BKA93DRAFT_797835 [Sparassis latifolia]